MLKKHGTVRTYIGSLNLKPGIIFALLAVVVVAAGAFPSPVYPRLHSASRVRVVSVA